MRCMTIPIREKGELSLYLWDNSKELYDGLRRPMVLLCPGGAYRMTSDREGEGMALKFVAMGCHAAVLRYSVAPARFPTALLELAQSVALIRAHADEWYVDPERIVVQGSSAGGHLAGCLGVFWKEDWLTEALGSQPEERRPNGLILSYPLITAGPLRNDESFRNLLGENYPQREQYSLEMRVNRDVPPVFLWHGGADTSVPPENSLLFALALRSAGVPVELHLYAVGQHGLGTAGPLTMSSDGRGLQPECATWMELAHTWLGHLGK